MTDMDLARLRDIRALATQDRKVFQSIGHRMDDPELKKLCDQFADLLLDIMVGVEMTIEKATNTTDHEQKV